MDKKEKIRLELVIRITPLIQNRRKDSLENLKKMADGFGEFAQKLADTINDLMNEYDYSNKDELLEYLRETNQELTKKYIKG